jgi:ribose transport system permease protein
MSLVFSRVRRPGKWVWPLAAALVLWLIACLLAGHFVVRLLLFSATLSVFLGLAGLAQMVVVTSGDGSFDLSLPYVMTLSAFISVGVMHGQNSRLIPGVLAGVAVAVAIGVANGVFVAGPKIPPIVTTLAMGYIAYTIVLEIGGQGSNLPSPALTSFVQHQVVGVSPVLAIEVAICIAVAFILKRTVYGVSLRAMGQNRRASYLAGVPVRRMIIANFAFSGLLAGCAGVLLAAYDAGAFLGMGDPFLLGSVAAVVIGGTRVGGGSSTVAGTALGALVMTLLITVLELSKFSAGPQDILEGAVVIGVVAIPAMIGGARRQPA